jgi:hypothetical protein
MSRRDSLWPRRALLGLLISRHCVLRSTVESRAERKFPR